MQIEQRGTTRGARARRTIQAVLAGAMAVGACASANADYVFTTIDFPGAVFTDVRGLNDAGQIVGYASLDGVNNFGFLYSGGTFAPLPAAPGGLVTTAHGINNSGTIIGSASPADGSSAQGFLLNGTTYTLFSYPGKTHTYARSINAAGIVTGYADDEDSSGPIAGTNVGFLYDPSTGVFTDIVVPGASFVIAQGINLTGMSVGSAKISGKTFGYGRQPDGTLNTFQIDNHFTAARGINDAGVGTGFNYDATSGHMVAFVADSGTVQLLRANTLDETFAEAINNDGQISGLFYHLNADGSSAPSHGFIATPAALPTGSTSGGAYSFSTAVAADVPIFIDPPTSAGYDYATGSGDPQFVTVSLPIGIGDSHYTLIVSGNQYPLSGGEVFDFRTHGFPGGVNRFRVAGIETSAAINPNNPSAFPTQLAFSGAGQFTGSMTALCLWYPPYSPHGRPSQPGAAALLPCPTLPVLRR